MTGDHEEIRQYHSDVAERAVDQMLSFPDSDRATELLHTADALYDALVAGGIPALHAANVLTSIVNYRLMARMAGAPSFDDEDRAT